MTDLAVDWDLLGDAPLAIAVSGGADSFALLHACSEKRLPVVALTVDHSLREGSAEDARVVATWCAERGVPHETLRWAGEKPKTGIQDAARTARYRLLCEACERLGLDRLATGHTLDDQAETVFMRLRRGAGRGLAGMPPSRKIASGPGKPVMLLRPMLGVRRAEARAYAEAAGLPVHDDPSNEDEGFERVRVRALLGALEEQGLLTGEALGRTAEALQLIETASLSAFIDRYSSWFGLMGVLHAEPSGKEPGDAVITFQNDRGDVLEPSVTSVVERLVEAIGTGRPTNDLHALLRDRRGATLNGATVAFTEEACKRPVSLINRRSHANTVERAVIYREPAALMGRADGTPGLAPVPAEPGTKHLYDRRFIVTVPADVPRGTELRPLGQLLPRDIVTSTLARARVSTLPCLARNGVVTRLPRAALGAVREAWGGWKRAGAVMPHLGDDEAVFEARSLLAERFVNEVIRY